MIIDCEFEEKVILKPHSKPKTVDGVEMNKKVLCAKCNEDWGVTALIDGVEWMCLKVCSFVLQFNTTQQRRVLYKKWKDVPFEVPDATLEELLSLPVHNDMEDLELDF